jgi:hypothetical protein
MAQFDPQNGFLTMRTLIFRLLDKFLGKNPLPLCCLSTVSTEV